MKDINQLNEDPFNPKTITAQLLHSLAEKMPAFPESIHIDKSNTGKIKRQRPIS